jgi:hypothetical protein
MESLLDLFGLHTWNDVPINPADCGTAIPLTLQGYHQETWTIPHFITKCGVSELDVSRGDEAHLLWTVTLGTGKKISLKWIQGREWRNN